jgi:hypothetical protein
VLFHHFFATMFKTSPQNDNQTSPPAIFTNGGTPMMPYHAPYAYNLMSAPYCIGQPQQTNSMPCGVPVPWPFPYYTYPMAVSPSTYASSAGVYGHCDPAATVRINDSLASSTKASDGHKNTTKKIAECPVDTVECLPNTQDCPTDSPPVGPAACLVTEQAAGGPSSALLDATPDKTGIELPATCLNGSRVSSVDTECSTVQGGDDDSIGIMSFGEALSLDMEGKSRVKFQVPLPFISLLTHASRYRSICRWND